MDGAKDERRIRVNSIHPGYIHTEMMEATCYGANTAALKRASKRSPSATPSAAWASRRNIANGAIFLASEESSFITRH